MSLARIETESERVRRWTQFEHQLDEAVFRIRTVAMFRESEMRMRSTGRLDAADRYRQLADAVEDGTVNEFSEPSTIALFMFYNVGDSP